MLVRWCNRFSIQTISSVSFPEWFLKILYKYHCTVQSSVHFNYAFLLHVSSNKPGLQSKHKVEECNDKCSAAVVRKTLSSKGQLGESTTSSVKQIVETYWQAPNCSNTQQDLMAYHMKAGWSWILVHKLLQKVGSLKTCHLPKAVRISIKGMHLLFFSYIALIHC